MLENRPNGRRGEKMEKVRNLENLPKEVRRKILPYMNEMLKIHGENVDSIFIYGSAAAGNYRAGESDVNSAVVFKKLSFEELKKSLKLVNRGIRKRIVAPLFFTPEYIKTSSDTFPIEFLEMKENHVLIYGEDPLTGLEIDPSHIRFICEEQLKGKLIRIRQAYLEIGLRKKGMEALVKESLNSLLPVFRGLLRLKGVNPSRSREENIKLLSKSFDIDADTFFVVLKDEKNDEKVGGEDIEAFLKRYIDQIEILAEAADKL